MISSYFNILGLMDTLNDWNEKLNKFFAENGDNVFVGTLIVGGIFLVGFWAIRVFNKR